MTEESNNSRDALREKLKENQTYKDDRVFVYNGEEFLLTGKYSTKKGRRKVKHLVQIVSRTDDSIKYWVDLEDLFEVKGTCDKEGVDYVKNKIVDSVEKK